MMESVGKTEQETPMISKKTWKEFRDTGLFFLVNQLLHVFGWAIVFDIEGDEIIEVFPARVKFRGFDDASQTAQHIKIANYMVENAAELKEEAEA